MNFPNPFFEITLQGLGSTTQQCIVTAAGLSLNPIGMSINYR